MDNTVTPGKRVYVHVYINTITCGRNRSSQSHAAAVRQAPDRRMDRMRRVQNWEPRASRPDREKGRRHFGGKNELPCNRIATQPPLVCLAQNIYKYFYIILQYRYTTVKRLADRSNRFQDDRGSSVPDPKIVPDFI